MDEIHLIRLEGRLKTLESPDDLDKLEWGDVLCRKNLGYIVFDCVESEMLVLFEQDILEREQINLEKRRRDHVTILETMVYLHSSAWDETIELTPKDGEEYSKRREHLEYLGLFKV